MNVATVIEGAPDTAVAVTEPTATVTYGELRARVGALRGGLVGLGVGPGDRVGIVAGNGLVFVETYLAVVGIGAVAVALNPDSPPPELARQLAAVEAKLLVAEAAPTDQPSVERVVVADDSDPTWAELRAAAPVPVADVAADTVATLLFTSGTAGAPRAAMLTHGSLRANVDQLLAGPDRIGPDDVVLGALPCFHIFGLTVTVLLTFTAGACLVTVPRFDPASSLDLIHRQAVTIVPGAPPMWAAWSRLPEAQPAAFATVRHALSGAAPLPDDVAETMQRRFGVVVREGYGLTEASPVVTTSVGIEARRGSVGRALDGIEIRLVDAGGDDVVVGDPGEIWVRGANVFAGYWADPAATARVLTSDRWLRTGDIAVVDDEGYLYIVGSSKDLVIVSGFNVYPAEVEHVLIEHPDVAEAVVIGVPHPYSGQAVKALVVPAPGATPTEAELIAHCRAHLARYKCPVTIELVDELPRGATGKILRRILS
jgi:long-chain acyl-CoA synthetase